MSFFNKTMSATDHKRKAYDIPVIIPKKEYKPINTRLVSPNLSVKRVVYPFSYGNVNY
jgi:hypothetical protein